MNTIWKLMGMYLLVILLILVCGTAFGQNICKKDIWVVEFNAGWNDKTLLGF